VTYSIPSGVGGQWTVYNNTTGSYTVTIASAGGGSSYTVVQSGRTVLLSDGTNIVQSTQSVGGSTTQVQYNNNGIIAGSSNFTFDGTNIALAGTMAMGSPFLRNRLINGSMQIAQYGTSGTLANGASGYVCCDRWIVQNNLGSTASVLQNNNIYYGGTKSFNIYTSSTVPAGSAAYFYQRIEAQNIADLAGQTVTLSFYTSASAPGATLSANVTISYPSALDNWASYTTPITLSFPITTSPTRFTKTFTLPSQCTNGAQIVITTSTAGGSASYFSQDVSSVQLEAGSVATPFEQQSIGQILTLCQRYYEIGSIFSQSAATGASGSSIQYVVTKRTTPTFAFNSISYSGSNSLAQQAYGTLTAQTGYNYNVTSASGYISANWLASAEL